jgi:hypothetical protein
VTTGSFSIIDHSLPNVSANRHSTNPGKSSLTHLIICARMYAVTVYPAMAASVGSLFHTKPGLFCRLLARNGLWPNSCVPSKHALHRRWLQLQWPRAVKDCRQRARSSEFAWDAPVAIPLSLERFIVIRQFPGGRLPHGWTDSVLSNTLASSARMQYG